jgi:hypothetical protein
MDSEQFTDLLRVVRETLLVPQTQETPITPRSQEHHRVSWKSLTHLDTSQAGNIDFWFMSFEQLMAATLVPQDRWAEKFVECPHVDANLKRQLGDLHQYEDLRLKVLKDHGPTDRISFYRRELHHVKGHFREELREKLLQIFEAYNRAAKDSQVTELQTKDLCYPFADAFPQETSQRLLSQLALAFAQDDPFEQIYRLAPEKRNSHGVDFDALRQDQSGSTMAVLSESLEPKPKRPRKEGKDALTKADLKSIVGAVLSQLGENNNKPRQIVMTPGNCGGCGGTCANRLICPAQGRTCFRCGGFNHFDKACKRSMPNQPGPRFTNNSFNPNRVVQGSFPRPRVPFQAQRPNFGSQYSFRRGPNQVPQT